MSAPTQFVMAGTPATGKTSFLALLYSSLVNDKAGGFQLGNYQDEREYLNTIAKRLEGCDAPQRTVVGVAGELALTLKRDGAESGFLKIPDVSGETWEQNLIERQWDEPRETLIRASRTGLVFIHPKTLFIPTRINMLSGAVEALGGDPEERAGDSQPDQRVRTQAQVTDLLQLLSSRLAGKPARIGLVISAWDLVPGKVTPQEWVEQNTPLVAQYLRANTERFESHIWGVSAQGGSWTSDEEREKLAELDVVDRAGIVSADGTTGDIGSLLDWALGEEWG